jgi:hypothetical protein
MALIRPGALPRVTAPVTGDSLMIDGATARSILVSDFLSNLPQTINATHIQGSTANGVLYNDAGGVLQVAAPTPSGVLTYSGAGVPSSSTTLPNGLTIPSPALTGTPTAPTPTTGDNSTKIATTAYVLANGASFNYTQAETGAVSSPLIRRLTNTLYASEFGAVGDDSTNDATALQAFLSAVASSGKEGRFDPGKSYFVSGADLLLAPAVASKITALYGFGSQIRTDPTQSRTGLTIQNVFVSGGPRAQETRRVLVDGLRVSQYQDANALFGFSVVGSTFVTLRDCSVLCGSDSATVPSVNYAAFSFNQSNLSDPSTGSFWCEVDTCTVKGAATPTPNGIAVFGQCNALHIRDTTISNATEGVLLARCNTASSSTTAQLPNGVRIHGCDFEGGTDAISCLGVPGFSTLAGLTVTNCRAESLGSFFNYHNIDLNAVDSSFPFFSGNYIASSVTTPFFNPNNLPINVLSSGLKASQQSVSGAQLDVSSAAGYSVATGANAVVTPGVQNYLICIAETLTFGGSAVYVCSGAAQPVLLGGASGYVAGTTTPAAGKASVGYDGVSTFRVYNNVGSTCNFKVLLMRMG